MKDARYLFRCAHAGVYHPADHARLLAQVRELADPYKGKAINLRVSRTAVEFDVFCSPDIAPSVFHTAFIPLGQTLTVKRLDGMPEPRRPLESVREARSLFNEHRFWEVHEVLEELWKKTEGLEKQGVQGLILVAAALVHAQKDENAVMWTMLADALLRLKSAPDDYFGWNLRDFRSHFERVLLSRQLEIPTV